MSLYTRIITDQTVGEVIQVGALQEEASRKVWGVSPVSQVLKVLQEAELQPLTCQLETVTICEDKFSTSGELNLHFILFLLHSSVN